MLIDVNSAGVNTNTPIVFKEYDEVREDDTVTVNDLITALKDAPPEAIVCIQDNHNGGQVVLKKQRIFRLKTISDPNNHTYTMGEFIVLG